MCGVFLGVCRVVHFPNDCGQQLFLRVPCKACMVVERDMGRLNIEYHGTKHLGRANWDLRDNQGSYRSS